MPAQDIEDAGGVGGFLADFRDEKRVFRPMVPRHPVREPRVVDVGAHEVDGRGLRLPDVHQVV